MIDMKVAVEKRLEEINRKPIAAATRVGLERGYINDIVRGRKKSISPEKIPQVAEALDWTFEEAVRALGIDPRSGEPPSPPPGFVKPEPAFLGARDLPVFSAVEGGPGEIVWGTTPFKRIPRPWYVEDSHDAMAILVTGESMVPVIRPGQMVVIDPRLPPLPSEPAVFISELHGEFKATIKELRRSTATDWHVYQYNPPDGQEHEFKLPKADWPKAHRVVGWFAGR